MPLDLDAASRDEMPRNAGASFKWRDASQIPPRGHSVPLDALDGDIPPGLYKDALSTSHMQEMPVLLDLDDVADWEGIEVPPRRWLVEGWLPVGEASLLTGAGSVGKSLVSQQLAAMIAAGQPFMGVRTEQATTIYITCEDGPEETKRRHKAIAGMIGYPFARGRCHAKSWKGESDLELATFDAERRLRPTKRFEALRATALAKGARLIVLDNTSHLFGGDENVKREVAAFANLLNGLAAEIDGVVLLLGHPNKTGLNNPGAGDANQFGGSVAWENQVRSRMFMSFVPDDDDARELTNPKANYSGRGGNKLLFRWHNGAFVRDDDMPEDKRAEIAATAAAASDNALFLACLAERTRQRRAVSEKHSPTYAPSEFAKMAESKGIGKARLDKAMNRLFRIGKIERGELWKGDDRKPVFGLRETAGNGAGDTVRETRETVLNTAENRAGNAGETHTYSIYTIQGAAHEAAAPSPEMDDGLDANGNIIGWNDDRRGYQ